MSKSQLAWRQLPNYYTSGQPLGAAASLVNLHSNKFVHFACSQLQQGSKTAGLLACCGGTQNAHESYRYMFLHWACAHGPWELVCKNYNYSLWVGSCNEGVAQAYLNYIIDYVTTENHNIPTWQVVYSNVNP